MLRALKRRNFAGKNGIYDVRCHQLHCPIFLGKCVPLDRGLEQAHYRYLTILHTVQSYDGWETLPAPQAILLAPHVSRHLRNYAVLKLVYGIIGLRSKPLLSCSIYVVRARVVNKVIYLDEE
ncbi:hypothetical protein GE21DRAFT_1273546 [Neurospora crassa]|nr:hypothetical protein GE21DRAFT_1273546 [Neurospora crassa]